MSERREDCNHEWENVNTSVMAEYVNHNYTCFKCGTSRTDVYYFSHTEEKRVAPEKPE